MTYFIHLLLQKKYDWLNPFCHSFPLWKWSFEKILRPHCKDRTKDIINRALFPLAPLCYLRLTGFSLTHWVHSLYMAHILGVYNRELWHGYTNFLTSVLQVLQIDSKCLTINSLLTLTTSVWLSDPLVNSNCSSAAGPSFTRSWAADFTGCLSFHPSFLRKRNGFFISSHSDWGMVLLITSFIHLWLLTFSNYS